MHRIRTFDDSFLFDGRPVREFKKADANKHHNHEDRCRPDNVFPPREILCPRSVVHGVSVGASWLIRDKVPDIVAQKRFCVENSARPLKERVAVHPLGLQRVARKQEKKGAV